MSHVSPFEVHAFVSRGETSVEFERHVSECARCAAQLSGAARRVVSPAVVQHRVVTPPLQFALVAFAACLAVLLVRSVTLHLPVTTEAPEGLHGVPSQSLSLSLLSATAEPVDSGVR